MKIRQRMNFNTKVSKMKIFWILLVAVCLVAAQRPSVASFGRQRCDYKCDSYFDVVCGVDAEEDEEPKLFGNTCMMKTFNCLNDHNYEEAALSNCISFYGSRRNGQK